MATGGIITPYTQGSAPIGTGRIECIYNAPDDAPHTTQWRIDGGSWRNVGVAPVTVTVATHTVTFQALIQGDTPPGPQTFAVGSGKKVTLKVYYN